MSGRVSCFRLYRCFELLIFTTISEPTFSHVNSRAGESQPFSPLGSIDDTLVLFVDSLDDS